MRYFLRSFILLLVWSVPGIVSHAQGKLFIIGGGDRPGSLMQVMVDAANLSTDDYIAVLPMSSAEPDSSWYYFRKGMLAVTKASIVNLDFTGQTGNQPKLDSLRRAKLIFITGGDQSRFMRAVLNTPVYAAIHEAFDNGAMVAGSSAGAAVMSEHMITGRQLRGDSVVRETINQVKAGNIEFSPGLGLLKDAIIDQHFIRRSRYNRALSALEAYPSLACIGIDEATAILVAGKQVSVHGRSQVILFRNPVGLSVSGEGLIKFTDIELRFLTDGDRFTLK